MSDKISKFLNLSPLQVAEEESTELVPVTNTPTVNNEVEEIKENIKDLVNVAKAATAEMYTIATSSQQSRDYDTLAKMIKTSSDVNMDYMEVEAKHLDNEQKKRTKDVPEGEKSGDVHNTIVFQGTTEEMLKQLEDLKK